MPSSRHAYGPYATGALRHEPDPRDYHLHRLPGVAAAAQAGYPEACDLLADIHGSYLQGALPACVVASLALVKSIEDQREHGTWDVYDWEEAFGRLGGGPGQPVPTLAALQFVQREGLRLYGGQRRYRIGSYAFAPRDTPELFVSTLKAAIYAGQPCVVALRLPEQLGWDSSGPATEAYHQMGYVGFDPYGALFKNTWGDDWGRHGCCRIPWDFLTADGFQGGDCYAYTVIDAIDPDLAPPGA